MMEQRNEPCGQEMHCVVLDGYTLCAGDMDFSGIDAIVPTKVYDHTPREQIVERIGDAQIVLTNKTLITAEVMRECPNVRYIGLLSTGCNAVDLDAAANRGIVVTNVPAYSTEAVAQHTIALLLTELSRVAEYDRAVKDGKWARSRDFCFFEAKMEEAAGKTMGLIGYGSIGRKVAALAEALGMRVLIYTRTPKKADRPDACVSFDKLLRESDVISLHCPLTAETKGIISQRAIDAMKAGVRVINTARGPLVESKAMADALASGKVKCYMTDVLECEPPQEDDPILNAPNTVITPHVAWAPYQTRRRLMEIATDNVRAYLKGEPIHTV